MVYLIHFETKFKGVQHYIGYSAEDKFKNRIEHHRKNTGARLMRAVNLAGIKWNVVREWPNENGHFERKLKNQRNHALLCPKCKASKTAERKARATNKKLIQQPNK